MVNDSVILAILLLGTIFIVIPGTAIGIISIVIGAQNLDQTFNDISIHPFIWLIMNGSFNFCYAVAIILMIIYITLRYN